MVARRLRTPGATGEPRCSPPDQRPTLIRLDWQRMGLAGEMAADGVYRYPPGYRPWMLPEVYDSRTPGHHNGGHVEPFARMLEGERTAVMEFLKLL